MIANRDISVLDENSISTINNKKERIEALAKIAKQKLDKGAGYNETIQELHNVMTVNWVLSSGTEKEYLRAMKVILEHNYGIKLYSETNDDQDEVDNSIITGKAKKLSKNNIFLQTMQNLSDEEIPIPESILVDKLEKSGAFTRDEAKTILSKMKIKSVIYEPKSGYYKLV